jgi:hypothetical protein
MIIARVTIAVPAHYVNLKFIHLRNKPLKIFLITPVRKRWKVLSFGSLSKNDAIGQSCKVLKKRHLKEVFFTAFMTGHNIFSLVRDTVIILMRKDVHDGHTRI